tara:strand:- start:65 stop:1204 length:1140 start_codon:yes stop_codon:yes gene_type:complete
MGYSGYGNMGDEWNMEGGIRISPDMTEIYANDKELQELLKRQSQYVRGKDKKWDGIQSLIEHRQDLLKFKGSSSSEKVKKNQVAQGYFDQDTKKSYINNVEVSNDEYYKFLAMTPTDQLINYGQDAEDVEIKTDKKGITDVLTTLDQIVDVEEKDQEVIDKSLGRENTNEVEENNTDATDNNSEVVVPPEESATKSTVPPIIIQHSECGHLTIGQQKKGDLRPRDVGLYASKTNALRLFRDGGFDLRSSEDGGEQTQKGSSIKQVCPNAPLIIKSEGSMKIDVAKTLEITADKIIIKAENGSEDGIDLLANHDIRMEAKNNTIITSDNITIDAKERVLTHSEGWTILVGQCVRIHEPVTKLCPAPLEDYIKNQIKTLKG